MIGKIISSQLTLIPEKVPKRRGQDQASEIPGAAAERDGQAGADTG